MSTRQVLLRKRWLGVIFLIFTGACSPAAPLQIATPTAPQNTPTLQPSNTRTATITPSLTPNLSPTPTSTHTPTSTWTLTPSWTPRDTLEPTQALEVAERLLETNNGCLLPCWWGFIPGKTEWREAQQFLETFASVSVREKEGEIVGAEVNLWISKRLAGAYLPQFYRLEDGVIQSMEVYPGFSPLFQFRSFINQYGKPAEVWIDTYQNEGPYGVPFGVYLYYPEIGILAFYAADAKVSGDLVRGCLRVSKSYPKFGLWDPQIEMSFEESAKLFRFDFLDKIAYPIEQAGDMDVDTFYRTALSSEVCIQTPAHLWSVQ